MTSREFSAYWHPLKMVPSFKYLSRVLSVVDDDWPTVVKNLAKAWKVWQRVLSILSREGERTRVSVFVFKAVFQSVLLFGAETCLFNPHMGRVLGVFQYQVIWQLTGRIPRRRLDGNWDYTMAEAGR